MKHLWFCVALVACSSALPGPRAIRPDPAAETTSLAGGALDSQGRPLVRNCVLHYGETTRKKSSNGKLEEASCHFNAECVAHPGQGGLDLADGFIYLDCRWTQCECKIESIARGKVTFNEKFSLQAPCADAQTAERLLIERCMVSAKLAEEAPAGVSPGR